MRKPSVFLLAALLLTPALSLRALDIGNGFKLGGGVKTGFEIKNSDYTGKLEGIGHAHEYPMTLYFASRDNESYNGEGWFSFSYSGSLQDLEWGLGLGGWAHGGLKSYENNFHMGDHYLWANFFNGQLRIIGGEGGGTPIKSGGWLDADWLSYRGIRVFYISPFGLSLGVNFADPGSEGIKPVEYLSTIMLGAQYEYRNFQVSVLLDNNPVYDDSNANYDGGIHGYRSLIGQTGNVGIGAGLNNVYAGEGMIFFDMIISNLGEDHITSALNPGYVYSPVEVTAALKTGRPWFNGAFYTEFKAKYFFKQGDNADMSGPAVWGLLTLEPSVSYEILPGIKAELSVTPGFYLNSYYLALDLTPNASGVRYTSGQIPAIAAVGDYASTYTLSAGPKISCRFSEASFVLGYEGVFSRDHVENILYIDFRWAF